MFERAAVIEPCVCNWIFERKERHANPSANHGLRCVTARPSGPEDIVQIQMDRVDGPYGNISVRKT